MVGIGLLLIFVCFHYSLREIFASAEEECSLEYTDVYNVTNPCWYELNPENFNCTVCQQCLYPCLDDNGKVLCVNSLQWETICTGARYTFELNGRLACGKCHDTCEECFGNGAHECLRCKEESTASDTDWLDFWAEGVCQTTLLI